MLTGGDKVKRVNEKRREIKVESEIKVQMEIEVRSKIEIKRGIGNKREIEVNKDIEVRWMMKGQRIKLSLKVNLASGSLQSKLRSISALCSSSEEAL